jgi:hypothetical protein
MAHIKSVRFSSVGKSEGCTCDRCGQYIQNIWTVTFTEGMILNYGIDCFEKVQKTGLSAVARKNIKKALKSIQAYEEQIARFTSGERNEENDLAYKWEQQNKQSAWYGEPYEKYRDWFINEFFPYRISLENETIAKYSKIDITP